MAKKFRKAVQQNTQWSDDGYPLYRRCGRYTYEKNGFVYTDSHVVPYNPILAKQFEANINVEALTTSFEIDEKGIRDNGMKLSRL
jgi:hypothetical protein